LWLKHSNEEERNKQREATVMGLIGISPTDELEGMMAAQLLAAHNAAMECYRRAMIAEQTFEGRRENLNQANKLSRSYAVLLEALNRHRGKGQQKVTVEQWRWLLTTNTWLHFGLVKAALLPSQSTSVMCMCILAVRPSWERLRKGIRYEIS